MEKCDLVQCMRSYVNRFGLKDCQEALMEAAFAENIPSVDDDSSFIITISHNNYYLNNIQSLVSTLRNMYTPNIQVSFEEPTPNTERIIEVIRYFHQRQLNWAERYGTLLDDPKRGCWEKISFLYHDESIQKMLDDDALVIFRSIEILKPQHASNIIERLVPDVLLSNVSRILNDERRKINSLAISGCMLTTHQREMLASILQASGLRKLKLNNVSWTFPGGDQEVIKLMQGLECIEANSLQCSKIRVFPFVTLDRILDPTYYKPIAELLSKRLPYLYNIVDDWPLLQASIILLNGRDSDAFNMWDTIRLLMERNQVGTCLLHASTVSKIPMGLWPIVIAKGLSPYKFRYSSIQKECIPYSGVFCMVKELVKTGIIS